MISITSNIANVRGGLADLVQRQVPFALASGLNNITLEAREYVKQRQASAFIIRRPWVLEGFRVKLTKKSDPVKRTAIWLDDSRSFFAKFEKGGRKTSQSGVALSVPVRKSPTAIVPDRMRIRNLGLRKHVTSGGKVQLKGKEGTFSVRGTDGLTYILQRVGNGRTLLRTKRRKRRGGGIGGDVGGKDPGVRVLYSFRRSVPIDDRLGFEKGIRSYVANEYQTVMAEALRNAIATAKVR